MAIVQLEDLTGQAEAVIFPRSFERIGSLIVQDARLMIWGKIDKKDDRTQLIVEDAEPIEDVQLVMVELNPHMASDIQEQHRLRNVLLQNRGDEDKSKTSVVAIISDLHQRQMVRLGMQFRVQDYHATVLALKAAGFEARTTSLTSA